MQISSPQLGGNYEVAQQTQEVQEYFEFQESKRREPADTSPYTQAKVPKEEADPRDVARFEKHYDEPNPNGTSEGAKKLQVSALDASAPRGELAEESAAEDNEEVGLQHDNGDEDDEENPFKQRTRHLENPFQQNSDQSQAHQQQRVNPNEVIANIDMGEFLQSQMQEQHKQQGSTKDDLIVKDPAAYVNDIADKVLSRLLVSDPSKSEKREVRLQFSDDILPGIEVQMEHTQGTLQVRLNVSSREQFESLAPQQQALQEHLSQALGEDVEVLFGDVLEDADQEFA